jgi:hypothetical protein
MDQNEISHDPRHLGITSGEHIVFSVQTVHQSYVKIRTISKWIKMSFQLSLVTKEYHRVRPKQFLSLCYVWRKPCTYLASRLTPSPNGPKQDSIGPTSLRSSIDCDQNNFWAYGTLATNRAPILCQDEHNLQTDRNELPVEPCHLGGPSGASKMISKPMVRLAQTMHLSCNDTKIVSKRTEMRFQITHVTKEFHQVNQKWFLSLWYIRCKPSTYLVSRLALSLNWPKRASSWASSPRRTIGCVQNDFWAYGMFGMNRAPILHPNGPKWDSTWPMSRRSSIRCI